MQQQTFTFKSTEKKEPLPKDPPVKKEPETKTPKIFTVSEIVGQARSIIEGEFGSVWIVGEVSGFKRHSSGHCYLSLKDSNSVLPAAIFRGAASKIRFEIQDGLEVVCHGKFSLYQRGGQYQIIVDYLEPKGVGELQLAFEQLKKKLAAEGLFDKARKKPIPYLPKRIGVVTSPTGAAVRDILKVLKRRFPNIEVLIVPARVQGEGSAGEIASAIELLNQQGNIDVMIVGRGGGSLEDLWAFNEEVVARAIFASNVPVISAVGHEVDFTIADFVADFRAPTPSAAAEHAVPVKEEIDQYIERGRRQLSVELKRYFENQVDRVKDLMQRLSPPTKRYPDYYRYIDNLKERMCYSVQVSVNNEENIFKGLVAELNHLSPLSILSKGYSVVTREKDSKAVRSSKQVKKGDRVKMRFSKGSAVAEVLKVE